ncbi:hypothetical protein B0H12DRAFT_1077245 [Mycena haematopus]|nr:hypothetical protein B0H12DRAFT_1077245 [Mycena haematopus]
MVQTRQPRAIKIGRKDNFNDHDRQPYIHDFKIVLRHGNKETSFRVFAKRGKNISANLASTPGNAAAIPFPGVHAPVPNGGVFKLFGDISFMRLGAGPDGNAPISMQGRDARMVDYIFDSTPLSPPISQWTISKASSFAKDHSAPASVHALVICNRRFNMPPKTHTCTCALEKFSHEVPTKKWRAHQADLQAFLSGTSSLEDETNLLALQAARMVLSDDLESTSDDLPSIDPQSLLADMKQSIGNLPKDSTRKKQVAPALRAQRVFAALTSDIDRAVGDLRSHTSRNPEHLWNTVDKAREVVSIVAVSLQDYKDSPQKDLIITQLRNLERELEHFQRDLPPDPRPLSYDSAYAFNNPVEHLHFMAQLMVMFTLVCKHILNLGQKPVNFILEYMIFMIKLAFSVNSISTNATSTTAPDDNLSFDDALRGLPILPPPSRPHHKHDEGRHMGQPL